MSGKSLKERIKEMAAERDMPAPVLMPGAPAIHRRPGMAKPMQWSVTEDHEQIIIKLGNVTLPPLHYEDALTFGLAIQHHAKQAKRDCGDMSRHFRALGTLKAQ